MAMLPPKGTHVVYRLFDSDRQLLYVGRSGHLRDRLDEHSRRQPWWHLVAGLSWERCSSQADSVAREAAAIRCEAPRFNVQPGAAGAREAMVMTTCRLPRELHERLHRAARMEMRSVSDLQRDLLFQGLRDRPYYAGTQGVVDQADEPSRRRSLMFPLSESETREGS